jgi:hypothetical protein
MITKSKWIHGRHLDPATNFTNQRRTTNIFGFSIFKAKSKTEQQTKQKKLDFINSKPNTGNQKTNREKQRKYFWSFCV